MSNTTMQTAAKNLCLDSLSALLNQDKAQKEDDLAHVNLLKQAHRDFAVWFNLQDWTVSECSFWQKSDGSMTLRFNATQAIVLVANKQNAETVCFCAEWFVENYGTINLDLEKYFAN